MRKRIAIAGAVFLAALLATALASAATVRVGTLVLHADGGFEPRLLPKRAFAPIHFQGYGEVETTDGSVPPPLRHVKLEFDRDGRLSTSGLPVCRPGEIETASPQVARRLCRGAIVGRGRVAATVPLPLLGRVEVRSALTVFNGPRQGGDPTVLLHAQAPFPVSETYVVVVPIERRGGAYGYRAEFDVPPIAHGLGSLTYIGSKIGRIYRASGSERSYVSARCSDSILQTRGLFSFADGTVVSGSVFKVCRAKP
jgi:hypothetical protein